MTALAQELPDAGLPDASVGSGGPDMNGEENDPSGGTCLDDSTCDRGFQCVERRCVPRPVQNVGCSAAGLELLAGLSLVGLLRRRRS